MNHIDEDVLMKMALQLLEESEEATLREHLSSCEDCKARLARIQQDMELIGSLEPRIEKPLIPLPKSRGFRIPAWFKVAALLVIGFVSGYGVSQLSDGQVVCIFPYHVRSSPPKRTYPSFTPCESVDMAPESYSEAPDDSVSR